MAAATQAYRNLNKPGVVFSIRERGKVVDYANVVILANAKCKHPNANALKRIRNGKREVCAWVSGTLIYSGEDFRQLATPGWRRLNCDPKRYDYFCDAITGERVDSASQIMLCSNGAFYRS